MENFRDHGTEENEGKILKESTGEETKRASTKNS